MLRMEGNFYRALHRYGKDEGHFHTLLAAGTKYLPVFEHLYNSYFSSVINTETTYLIPKKIHQIWLGGEMPKKYFSSVESWASAKGWNYYLWQESDVEKMVMHNRDLYHLGKNYGEKSDILRLEILNQEGGLYVDVDSKCLDIHFFEHLHHTLSFYAGFEPLAHRWLGISNAILGASANHPLLQKLISDLKSNFFAHEDKWAVIKTGPKFLTTVIEEYVQKGSVSKMCVFPPPYFCPASTHDIKQENYEVFAESAALHFWSGSWMPFFGLNNEG